MQPKVYIGVDIGVKGGVAAILPDGSLELHTIPTSGSKMIDVDLFEIFASYSHMEMVIVLEEVHSLFGMSAKSNFSFGATFGKKVMIANICGHLYNSKFDLVPPKTWQKEIWTSSDKVYKTGKKVDTKKTSLLASKRLFPKETFLASARSRVPHDGLVDAALLAYYGKIKHG